MIYAIDYYTRKVIPVKDCIKTIAKLSEDGYYELIYISNTNDGLWEPLLVSPDDEFIISIDPEKFPMDTVVYDQTARYYKLKPKSKLKLMLCELKREIHDFPYPIPRKYGVHEHPTSYFNNIKVRKEYPYNNMKFLDYTYGVEFEGCSGLIPYSICKKDGLIPLRDGSITGIEYATKVIKTKDDMNLLRQSFEDFTTYCNVNKDCSLHIHIGGLPITSEYISNLCYLWASLENQLIKYCPPNSYRTERFKSNGKSYCKPWTEFINENDIACFEDLYQSLTGSEYLGNLNQPHPGDITRDHKWNVSGRYMNMNIINMICYGDPKTVEFRFLTPTKHFIKLLFWMYIFTAICKMATAKYDFRHFDNISLGDILNEIYPIDIAETLHECGEVLQMISNEQSHCGDTCGQRYDIEDKYWKEFEDELLAKLV